MIKFVRRLLSGIPFDRVNWVTSTFLMGTLLIAVTCVPLYIWHYGVDRFQIGMFLAFYLATGISITLGYHRLFSHLSFKAKWPVKLFVLIFGAAAFENAVLEWASDHRKHHKHVDHDGDPYDISRGFWFAHIGWLLFKLNPEPPMDNVADLEKDRLVMWQYKWIHVISIAVGMGLPALLGFFHSGGVGALGGFLLAGIARIVAVQQSTFCINSLCHTIGKRPYSSQCSARDSWVAALVTFGEGYHNFHHEFQHDYRNGVKPWQFDPTKWTIWLLSRLGLVSNLRRVPDAKIMLAEMREAERTIDSGLALWAKKFSEWRMHLPETKHKMVEEYEARIQALLERINIAKEEFQQAAKEKAEVPGKVIEELKAEIEEGRKMLAWMLEQVAAKA